VVNLEFNVPVLPVQRRPPGPVTVTVAAGDARMK
jgi:hypothetical protein